MTGPGGRRADRFLTRLDPERFETVLDSISDGVFAVDRDWRVTYFNRAAEEITGIPVEEALGRTCHEVFHTNICRDACALRYTMDTGCSVVNLAVYITDRHGDRKPVSISTGVFRDAEGAITGGVESFRDLSVVEDLRICSFFTAVTSRTVGLASTLRRIPHRGAGPPLRRAGDLLPASARALAELAFSDRLLEASVGLAALNSLLEVDPSRCDESNAGDLLEDQGRGRRIAVVGDFPFVKGLGRVADELWVFEQGDRVGPDHAPADRMPELLPRAELAAISSTTLLNHTLDGILAALDDSCFKMLVGPSTPLTPALFDLGFDALCGSIVVDRRQTLADLSQGATFRQVPEFGRTRLVFLQGWGEPFLNPRFFEMATQAKRAGSMVGVATNGTSLDERTATHLVRCDVDIVAFFLAGTDDDNDVVRRGTRLQDVIEAIQAVRRAKERHGSDSPAVHIAYLLLRSGLEGLPRLPGLIEGTGVQQVVISTLDFVPCRELARQTLRPESLDEYGEIRSRLPRPRC